MPRITKRSVATATMNGNVAHNNKKSKNVSEQERKDQEKKYRRSIVLWKRPLVTIEYFFREIVILLITYGKK